MPFDYYHRLSPEQRLIYRRSDEITLIELPRSRQLRPPVRELQKALEEEDDRLAQKVCQQVSDGITDRLDVPSVQVIVLQVRPREGWGELHGLYEPSEDDERPRLSLWMRTAERGRVVAFRTFLRTLVHELCHHVDYELLDLSETFHTEGFFKRESSLFRQLVGEQTS